MREPLASGVRECSTHSAVESPRPAVLTPAAVQLVLPLTVVLVGDATGVERMLRQRRYRRPACHAHAQQLEINLHAPVHHPPRAQGPRAPRCRPCRQRPVRPHAAADALALKHMDLAEKIAGNFARRTLHPKAPGFRKDVTPLIRTSGGLMERINASLQRGRQG